MTKATMTVTVRDRSLETWGYGLTTPIVRTVTISALCPVCGERRGDPEQQRFCDDGAWYVADVWTNPCGHQDVYPDVIAEAANTAICCQCGCLFDATDGNDLCPACQAWVDAHMHDGGDANQRAVDAAWEARS